MIPNLVTTPEAPASDLPVCETREQIDLVDRLIACESGDVGPLYMLETLAELVRTGLISGLQGSWQRSAASAIEGGLITPEGEVTDFARESLGDLYDEEEF